MYSTDSNKWKAYQFSDPFAATAFFVCNKVSKTFCRPDCDARPITNLKNEVKFVDTVDEALNYGFAPCKHCDPTGTPVLDVNVLMSCVTTINKKIGFMMPLVDENEDINNTKIKQNILESKKSNEERVLSVIDNGRRSSMPSLSEQDINLSKNDSDHYRLVDLACRHLAHAAAVSLFSPGRSPQEDNSGERRKKRRRGGVLGFKELAAKSKLSAWHFHRVFKSVTGLTPKTYGDKCHEFLDKHRERTKFNQPNTPVSSSPSPDTFPALKKMKLATPTSSSETVPSLISDATGSVSSVPSNVMSTNSSPMTQLTPELSPNLSVPQSNFNFDLTSKAMSVPDFTKLSGQQSLFAHNKIPGPQPMDLGLQSLSTADCFVGDMDPVAQLEMSTNPNIQLPIDSFLDVEPLPANLEAQLAPSIQLGGDIQEMPPIPEMPSLFYDSQDPVPEYDANENFNAVNYEFLSGF